MARLKFNGVAIGNARGFATTAKSMTGMVADGIATVQRGMQGEVASRNNIAYRLACIQMSVSQVESDIQAIYQTVDNASVKYNNAERQIIGWAQQVANGYRPTNYSSNRGVIAAAQFDKLTRKTMLDEKKANQGMKGSDSDDNRSWFAKFVGNNLKAAGSVLSGEISGEGELWGISTAGTLSGTVLTGEAGIESNASLGFDEEGKWDIKSFDLTTSAYATGALAKGTVEGNVGYLHGEASGQFLTGAVKGEAKMQFFEDGKINPAFMVSAKASGSVLQGEAEAGLGTDQFGVYGKAEGDVLHAEAEATAGIGYIGTDKDGNAQYGAKAEVSAMASIAQGEVKGGFTLWGIDIDIGAKGYAGAVGVEAGASVTTDGVKANFSGAAALGAGLEVSIDWSDAEWIEDGVDWIGDTAEDVGDFLFGWI